MPKILQENQVVYVEPNAIAGEDDFSAMGGGAMKAPSYEDYCIIVDLDVEVKGRTFSSSLNTGKDILRMEYTSSENNGERVKFMQGSKIYLDKEKKKYITSLTTDYTNTHLRDIENGGTCEMFGIKSIDISYNNFMVPDVTIQFTDVRGVSLFAQEEARHNITQGGMEAVANNDIEGSFFKCFFTFPYPKFTLRVKGYYGQMVSYELSCADFRCTFDSATGSFNVTANFIAYAFSFLTDLMANAVLAAPYSDYLGKEYWEANNGSRFFVYDSNGCKQPMVTLGELCKKFENVKASVESGLTEENIDSLGLSKEDKDALISPDLGEIKKEYDALIAQIGKIKPLIAIGNKDRDTFQNIDGTNSYFIISDNVDENIKELVMSCQNMVASLNNKINTYELKGVGVLQAWKSQHPEGLVWRETRADDNFYEAISENALKEKVYEYFIKYQKQLQDWINSKVYYFQDNDFKKVFATAYNSSDSETEEISKLREEVGNKLMIQQFNSAFNFPPTVENITRIFMAHVETFVQMVCDCATSIQAKGSSRTLGRIGANLDNFSDLPSTMSEGSIIPPFPKVTQEVDYEGTTKREDAWIGQFGDENVFEEIRLVNGLLKGVECYQKELPAYSVTTGGNGAEIAENSCSMPRPLTYMDMFMGKDDNPFGSINLEYPMSIFGHWIVRAYGNAFCGNTNFSEMGRLDAENFVYYFGKDKNINRLKNLLKTLTYEDVLRKVQDTRNQKDVPWPKDVALIKKAQKEDVYYIPMSYLTNNVVLPIKNWNWAEYKEAVRGGQYNKNSKWSGHYGITGTAVDKEGKKITDNSMTCIVYDKDLEWIENSLLKLPDCETKDLLSNKGRLDATQPVANAGKATCTLMNITKKSKAEYNELQYNIHGELTNPNDFLLDVWSVFSDSRYYQLTNLEDRAKFFVRRLFEIYNGDTAFNKRAEQVIEGCLNPELSNPSLLMMDKLSVLACGVYMKDKTIEGTFKSKWQDKLYYRFTTEKAIKEYFNTWRDTEFKVIANNYELKPKGNGNVAELAKKFQGVIELEGIKKIIKSFFDETSYNKVYENKVKYITYENAHRRQSVSKVGDENKDMIKSLFRKVCVGVLTTSNMQSSQGMHKLKLGDLQSYLYELITNLKSLLKVEEGTVDGYGDNESATMTLSLDGDSEDIKIGTYRYIKLLYDKWVAADTSNNFYKMEYMFDENRPTFYFVDSVYNKIGKTLFIDMGKLSEQIASSTSNAGLPLIGMLSNMYADNKFQLMFIQNFADRCNAEFMREMFTPIPYIEAKEPDNHPEYVVMYPYEASSRLDIKDSEYPDDGFYLNDSTTWPVMVSSKRAGVDLTLPAFGVTYGQQYQSYFKNIDVGMDSPMSTEQSITAKFLIAGANTSADNTGPRQIATGQDLFTIYANNSYTCTVTMMGCAWVQPMMYFVLNNIPMFRGSYQIVKVKHNIQAGNFITTFTGVRMARTTTRAVREFLIGNNLDSVADYQNQEEIFNHANANIGNDCDYAYYSPLPADGQDFSSELSDKLYDHLIKKGKDYLDGAGSRFRNWTILQALAAISYKEFEGSTDTAVANRAAIVACMYNKRGCKGVDGYAHGIFSAGWNYFVSSNYDNEKLYAISQNRKVMEEAEAMVRDIWSGGPYKYLVGQTNTWTNGKVTLEQVQKSFTTRGSSDSVNTLKSMAQWGDTQYALLPYGKQYHIVGGLNEPAYVNGFVPKPKPKGNDDITEYKQGLAKSIESSLKATQQYGSITMETVMGSGPWMKLVAKGNNATNAVFDCLIQTYGDWFTTAYWDIGTGNMNCDAIGVIIRVVKTPPQKHVLGLCHNWDMKGGADRYPDPPIRYAKDVTKDELMKEVNPSLRLALIKYFKKHGISDVVKARGVFTTLRNIKDTKAIEEVFELNKSAVEDSVQDCNTMEGYPTMGGSDLDGIDPAKVQDKSDEVIDRKFQQLFGTSTRPSVESQVTPFLAKTKVSTIGSNGQSKSITVELHKKLMPSFIAIMKELKLLGFKVDSINSYDWRTVPKTDRRSNHSYGVAVDINPGKAGNPWFDHAIVPSDSVREGDKAPWKMKYAPYNGTYKKDSGIWEWESIAVKTFAKYGWGWGGSYGDTMHFSYLGGK